MCARSDNFPLISSERHAITGSNGSTKTAKVQTTSRIRLYNVDHVVDLEACRIQMPIRIAELRENDLETAGVALIAKAADVDPKTLRTFLDGGRVRPESLIDIIERGLGLNFEDIVKPAKVA